MYRVQGRFIAYNNRNVNLSQKSRAMNCARGRDTSGPYHSINHLSLKKNIPNAVKVVAANAVQSETGTTLLDGRKGFCGKL